MPNLVYNRLIVRGDKRHPWVNSEIEDLKERLEIVGGDLVYVDEVNKRNELGFEARRVREKRGHEPAWRRPPIDLRFTSAHSAPFDVLESIARDHPNLDIDLSYIGNTSIGDFGDVRYSSGQVDSSVTAGVDFRNEYFVEYLSGFEFIDLVLGDHRIDAEEIQFQILDFFDSQQAEAEKTSPWTVIGGIAGIAGIVGISAAGGYALARLRN